MTSGKVLVYCEEQLVIFDTSQLLAVSAQDSNLVTDSNGVIIGQFQTLYNVELKIEPIDEFNPKIGLRQLQIDVSQS
jgi:hypothetical protein